MTDITTQDELRELLTELRSGIINFDDEAIKIIEAYKDNACKKLLDSAELVFLIGCIDVYREHFSDSDSQMKWENELSAKLQTMRNNLKKSEER